MGAVEKVSAYNCVSRFLVALDGKYWNSIY